MKVYESIWIWESGFKALKVFENRQNAVKSMKVFENREMDKTIPCSLLSFNKYLAHAESYSYESEK